MSSSSLLARQRITHPLRVAQSSVRYARPAAAAGGDPKLEIIRRALYPGNIRNQPSPTGSWRPDVGRALQRAIPSVQAHETIERAWKLLQRHQRQRREAERARKFECMRHAMQTLYELGDTHLYVEANRREDPRQRTEEEIRAYETMKGTQRRAVEARIRGLFPREIRIPTDTPSPAGWNYDFKPAVPSKYACEPVWSCRRWFRTDRAVGQLRHNRQCHPASLLCHGLR
jgi:large subunit ribosomal protein L40